MAKIFVTGSIYLTVAISVERYVTVCYPFFRFLLFLILICLLFHSDFPHCATLSSGFFSCSNPIQVTNSFRVSRAHLSAWCIVGTYNFFVTIFLQLFGVQLFLFTFFVQYFSIPFFAKVSCTTFFVHFFVQILQAFKLYNWPGVIATFSLLYNLPKFFELQSHKVSVCQIEYTYIWLVTFDEEKFLIFILHSQGSANRICLVSMIGNFWQRKVVVVIFK